MPKPISAPWQPNSVMTLAEHIAAAKDLGEAQRAMLRFLDVVSDRKHLPVRIIDVALRVDNLIHRIRCEMGDVQHITLAHPDRLRRMLARALQLLRW